MSTVEELTPTELADKYEEAYDKIDTGEAEKAWKVAVKSAPKGSDGVQVTGVLGNGP